MHRTHTCNELKAEHIGESVRLIGWIQSIREHGEHLVFIDLRDREGITQVVCDPTAGAFKELIPQLKDESVIGVNGTVIKRAEGTNNDDLATGGIEVRAEVILVHNICESLPFPMEDSKAEKVSEELRLKHRYLDLRRKTNRDLLRLRHTASNAARQALNAAEFTEVETPILFKSTPEGAREFLVPSRLNAEEFYALTQSPQQYKQMLMVAGVERYYSFAKCFRDEDLRADRQPEFTQIDIEMSFINREDMYALIENLLARVWKESLDVDIPTPFPRMPFKEAMNRFGIDKPDTRFGMELTTLTELFKESEFKVFASVANDTENEGTIRAINAKGLADVTQGEIKALEDAAKSLGAKGLAYIKVDAESGEWKSPILKFLSEKEQKGLKKALDIEKGDCIFFAAGEWLQSAEILGRVRLDAAQLLVAREKLSINPKQFNFLWVTDFPLMSYDPERGAYAATHHPFTAPVAEDAELLTSNPKKVRGQHYDIVLNGVELGGGSIRIHQPALQRRVFEDVLQIPKDIVNERFGYMLQAFEYGAPPHGGIALGLDRICAILGGRSSIRDVIAFPKTQRGQDLMGGAPAPVTPRQLKDVHIALRGE